MFEKKIFALLLVILFSFKVFADNQQTSVLHSDSIDILHYDIHLNITNFTSKQITGYTDLRITAKQNNVQTIRLDLLRLTIDSIMIDDNSVANYLYNDTLIQIPCFSPLTTNDTVQVKVFYHGVPRKDPSGWGGFYFSSSNAFNLGVGMQDNPHCYGRVWYPCIDDFVDRATYDYYITTTMDKIAVCCGTLQETITNDDETLTHHWNLSQTIPTYLSSVAIDSYVDVNWIYEGIERNIPTHLFVLSSDSLNAVNSFVNLDATMQAYETCFGAYSWDRVGYVGVPFNSGAMEHVANIAYPNSAINGTLGSETLMAHELSHHWFGNLVTCQTPEDMWLNEGWASYCEPIFMEYVYGEEAFRNYVRNNHQNVLRMAHISDDGYRAISGVPHEHTYSTTVYDKGASVVHTLRGYLGDELFFDAVKNYLNEYAFATASSDDLKNSLTNSSNINLDDFFNFWVHEKGFTHFSVDSFQVESNATPNYEVTVFMRQKLKGTTTFANGNKVEITFADNQWNSQTEVIEFSGEYGQQTFSVAFLPSMVLVDLEEKVCDATTDNYQLIKNTGEKIFPETYFKTDITEVSDSVILRVEHSWVKPDDLQHEIPNLIAMSDCRYWQIDGVLNDDFNAKGYFYFAKAMSGSSAFLDNSWIEILADHMVLLYRKNCSEDWQILPTTQLGDQVFSGDLVLDSLRLGQYTLGLTDGTTATNIIREEEKFIKVYPNPTQDTFVFELQNRLSAWIEIYDTAGKKVFRKKVSKYNKNLHWTPEAEGVYILNVMVNQQKVQTEKIIFQK